MDKVAAPEPKRVHIRSETRTQLRHCTILLPVNTCSGTAVQSSVSPWSGTRTFLTAAPVADGGSTAVHDSPGTLDGTVEQWTLSDERTRWPQW